MADIFISYTSSDRDWAFWIGYELEALDHVPHVHDWEIPGGGDIMAWMEERHDTADRVLCIVSNAYLKKPYSSIERRAAQWAALTNRPNFLVPIFIEPCKTPTLFATVKRCDLYDLAEEDARARLKIFLAPPVRPPPGPFPGAANAPRSPASTKTPPPFPSKAALSNIPISVPLHFTGRDDALEAIEAGALKHQEGRVAITVLHGLRGVGKTTLAAAYAERHRNDCRATWWIRAQTDAGLRADLVALGIRLSWVGANDNEPLAVEAVMERLRHEGDGILLIFDNAVDANALKPYLPRGGGARVLVTSNAHAWRGVAAPVEIRVWPEEIGAGYLIARTGREAERIAAEHLSETLGGLPLAHEQAAAYCERLDISLADYCKRFEAAPVRFLDDARHAPAEYHDGLTVAKTFALAIEEAAKLHSAAEPLITHAAMLAPEPIPLFLFTEAREKFGEPLASALAGEGLDEAVAALRTFALVGREAIVDERDGSIRTDSIRLHRLVREVAAARCGRATREQVRRTLFAMMTVAYPEGVFDDPRTWPRARRLDAPALALVDGDAEPPKGAEEQAAQLLSQLARYRHNALAAYAQERVLAERALRIAQKLFGPEHPITARKLNDVGFAMEFQDDLEGAQPFYERALAINEKRLGPEHRAIAINLHNLARLLLVRGNPTEARPLVERALAINKKVHGPEHRSTSLNLHILAGILGAQGDLAGSRRLYERVLATDERARGPEHFDTAIALNSLARLLYDQGDLAGALPLYERALAIYEKVFGPEHPRTASALAGLARLLYDLGDLAGALPLCERALAIYEKVLGPEHPDTNRVRALVLRARGG
jgi:tetratricopeptide (TPR) repeat protein